MQTIKWLQGMMMYSCALNEAHKLHASPCNPSINNSTARPEQFWASTALQLLTVAENHFCFLLDSHYVSLRGTP